MATCESDKLKMHKAKSSTDLVPLILISSPACRSHPRYEIALACTFPLKMDPANLPGNQSYHITRELGELQDGYLSPSWNSLLFFSAEF